MTVIENRLFCQLGEDHIREKGIYKTTKPNTISKDNALVVDNEEEYILSEEEEKEIDHIIKNDKRYSWKDVKKESFLDSCCAKS